MILAQVLDVPQNEALHEKAFKFLENSMAKLNDFDCCVQINGQPLKTFDIYGNIPEDQPETPNTDYELFWGILRGIIEQYQTQFEL